MIRLPLLLAILTTSGCASMMSAPTLSPEQYQTMAGTKHMAAACLTFTGVAGTGKSVFITIDQKVITDGGVSVDPNTCAVTITNAVPATPKGK